MNLLKLMIDWILNTWILFWDLFKGRKEKLSEGNKQRELITVEAEIHHGRRQLINNGRFKRKTETENLDRFQKHNNIKLINFDVIEKA